MILIATGNAVATMPRMLGNQAERALEAPHVHVTSRLEIDHRLELDALSLCHRNSLCINHFSFEVDTRKSRFCCRFQRPSHITRTIVRRGYLPAKRIGPVGYSEPPSGSSVIATRRSLPGITGAVADISAHPAESGMNVPADMGWGLPRAMIHIW